MRLFQYQRFANPVVAPNASGQIPPAIGADKWSPSIDAPQPSWRPAVAAACVLAAATAFSFCPVPALSGETILAGKWHPAIERASGQDLKRQQQLYPEEGFGPYPVPASIGGWQPQTNQTIFDQKRLQHLYPSLFYTESPYGAFTSAQWAALTNAQWAALTNAQWAGTFGETIYADKWHPEIERPPADRRRQQYLHVQADCRGNVPLVFLFAGNWHPEIQQPRFDTKRQQQDYPDQARGPLPIPAPVSGWHPAPNQPLFDRKLLQYLYPAEFRGDVPRTEIVSTDRWQGINPPLYDAKRQQALYPSEFRGDVPRTELVSADRWHPLSNQPVFDAKRFQALYPTESRDDIAGLETIRADKWHPLGNQPLFDAKRLQALYPNWAADQFPRTEIVSADRWHPLGNQPLFDAKRLQAIYPAEARDDIAGTERTSLDKWHLEIQRPVFLLPRAQWAYEPSAFDSLPIPPLVSGWQAAPNQPVFDAKRLQCLYPSECRGDVPRSETVKVDEWHPEAQRPVFIARRQQQTYQDSALSPYLVPAAASGWQPLGNQPLYDRTRLQYLYPAESRGDIPRAERVTPDRWLGVNPPLYDVRRQQAIYQSDFRGDIPRTEAIKVDEWQPLGNQPLFALRRQQQTYQDAALSPYLVPAAASGWQPLPNQPLYDQKRLQYLYPSESRGDAPRTEAIKVDEWHAEIQRPVFIIRRQQWTYPVVEIGLNPTPPPASGWHPEIQQPRFDTKRQQYAYPDQARAPLPVTPVASGWFPEIRQPVFDRKRVPYLYPAESRGDIPRIETLYERSWQAIEQPRFDVKRQQYLYPSLVADTLPRKEFVSIDRWHPPIERVLYDPRRAYRIANELTYADIPRNMIVGADRWTPSVELPGRRAPRPDPAIVQAFVAVPPPPVTWVNGQPIQLPVLPRFRPFDTPSGLGAPPLKEPITIDKWLPPIDQPLFNKPYFQWVYNPPPFPFLASVAPPSQRLQVIAPDVRFYPMNPENRFAIAGLGGSNMQQYTHSQNEVLDYGWDWSQWLEAIGDYITTSTWFVPSGIIQTNASIVSGTSITSVFLQGNKLGATYTITNRIVTASGRTAEQSFKLTIGTV